VSHLSQEQFAQWIAGERPHDAVRHVDACDPCRQELAGFSDALKEFSQHVQTLPVPARISAARRSHHVARWLAAAAAVMMLALVPVYREQQERRRALIEQQDAQLLQQVDAEISRAVPDSMDPLVTMVSWNTGDDQK
jgi:hypothetical protein